MNCHDCDVPPGIPHASGCDVARCLWDGGQRLQCEMFGVDSPIHNCGLDIWTGMWPGEMECFEFGFIREDGGADLNKLLMTASWDRRQQTWVL